MTAASGVNVTRLAHDEAATGIEGCERDHDAPRPACAGRGTTDHRPDRDKEPRDDHHG